MKDLNLFSSHRKERRGCGLGLIIKNIYNITTIAQGELHIFQLTKWKTKINHTALTTVGVLGALSGSNLDFLGEFTEWLTDNVSLDPNIVIAGDFNLHINNPNDDYAANFKDAMVVLGFRQHIPFPTHKSSNTLDLIFMEENISIKLRTCRKGNIISDDCLLTYTTTLTNPDITCNLVNYRNLKNIDPELMSADIKLDYYENIPLSNLFHQFDTS